MINLIYSIKYIFFKIKRKVTDRDIELMRYTLEEYEEAYKESFKYDFSSFLLYLRKKNMQRGVCYFLTENEDCCISRSIISRNCQIRSGFWYKPPYECISLEEIQECLIIRIEILENELSYFPKLSK